MTQVEESKHTQNGHNQEITINQKIFIPIVDHFFKIRIEVINVETNSFFNIKALNTVDFTKIGQVELNIPDIVGGL